MEEKLKFNQVPEDIAKKLAGIAALATGKGTTEAEQEAAMEALMRTANRYNVDVASILEADVTTVKHGLEHEPFVELRVRVAKGTFRRPPCHLYVIRILSEFFHVKICWSGSLVYFVGRRSRAHTAEYLYGFMVKTFNKLWGKARARHGYDPDERASYFEGLWLGLGKKLEKARRESEAEVTMALEERKIESNVGALILVAEDEKLAQAEKDFHPVIKETRVTGPKVRSYRATESGIADGGSIELSMPLENKERTALA